MTVYDPPYWWMGQGRSPHLGPVLELYMAPDQVCGHRELEHPPLPMEHPFHYIHQTSQRVQVGASRRAESSVRSVYQT